MLLIARSSMQSMCNFVSPFFCLPFLETCIHNLEDNNFCETSVPSEFNLATW